MVNYEVKLSPPDCAQSSNVDYIYIKLGTNGESEKVNLSGSAPSSNPGKEPHSFVPYNAFIENLALMEQDKQLFKPKEDDWFPAKVEFKSPEGETYSFPMPNWMTDSKEQHFFREKALEHLEKPEFRQMSLQLARKMIDPVEVYSWAVYKEGLPDCMKVGPSGSLPPEEQFSKKKEYDIFWTAISYPWLGMITLLWCHKQWSSMDKLCEAFNHRPTKVANYTRDHWKDDEFFGYQFLNGLNPMMIQRCSELPEKFPVTDEMVSLHGQESLTDEMMKGNIFLCDYKILDGVETNTINGKKQYLMAPLVLLQKTSDDKMMPIAIQLKQEPAEDNPVFFHTDSEYDWLLAKIFVRSADFNVHQLNYHLLRTHLLCEVFAVSLLRNVPNVHPLYKLLVPHTRYNLQIDLEARNRLISDQGMFTSYAASGGQGMITILRRSLSSLTYSSLCIPEDIAERGLKDVPNFYYRDDGLKLWGIINCFVKGIITYYYKNDEEVQTDTELQKWIRDIFEHGFLSNESTGIPQRFTTVDEVVKFVTMVIFTGSVQHTAVNSGQYDFGGWMPNSPLTLQRPPPTKKGEATEATMLATFPDINATVWGMLTLNLLSHPSADFVRLGQYPGHHFTEETPQRLIKEFQLDLELQGKKIEVRNSKLEMQHKLQYPYLDPKLIENSVTI